MIAQLIDWRTPVFERSPFDMNCRSIRICMIFDSAPQMTLEQKKLFDDNLPLALEIARKKSQDDADRPSVEQEARIGLKQAALKFDPAKGSPFKAYASKVIINQICDLYKKNQRSAIEITTLDADLSGATSDDWEASKDKILDPSPIPSHETERNEIRKALNAGIGQLTFEQGRIVEAYLIGHSFAEIARQNGTSEQNVGQVFRRAKEELRPLLMSQGVTTPRFMPSAGNSGDLPPIATPVLKSSPQTKEHPPLPAMGWLALLLLLLVMGTIFILYLLGK